MSRHATQQDRIPTQPERAAVHAGRSAPSTAPNAAAGSLQDSPRVVAQARALSEAFGPAVQSHRATSRIESRHRVVVRDGLVRRACPYELR